MVIFIKYKPMYEVTINNQKIGYVINTNKIENYINNTINNQQENIAFVKINNNPNVKLTLVNRTEKDISEDVINQLKNNTCIEYTTYAITYNGKNKAYVSNQKEAEELVETIKKEYSSNYTKKLGILQVYSNNLDEIKATNLNNATKTISKIVNKEKIENTNTVKVAKTNIITNTIKGVKFSVKPISGVITSRYGKRTSPGGIGTTNHKGIDIAAKEGTYIKAAANGVVTFAGYKGSLGNLVIINNGNNVETYYGHCSKIYVSKGQKVKAGDKISAVGQTGAATGPHLHLEIHINGTAINPQKYIY